MTDHRVGRGRPRGIDMVRSICCMATERYIKQSGRTWWRELSNKLSTIGFHRLESDWGLYTRPKSRKEGLVIILVYVDDFVIAAETKGDIDKLLEKLKTFWKLSEMGEVSTILGMKVTRDRKNRQAFLTQPAYIDRLLERFPKHANYRNWAAPLGKTTVTDGESVALSPYQEIIGCLQWLAGCTRPDISYAASFLARHTANPLENHWEMVTNELVVPSTKVHLWLDIPWIFIVKETARGQWLT